MDALKIVESIIVIILGAVPFFILVFIAYIVYIKSGDNSNSFVQMGKTEANIDYSGDISSPILGNAYEEMTVTTVKDSGWYIQNNNELIERQLRIFMPKFYANHFNAFAEDFVKRLIKTHGEEKLSLVGSNVDLSCLPQAISGIDCCYLHNYILCDNTEYLKLFCSVFTEGGERKRECFFFDFKRNNPLISIKSGKILAVTCPACGNEIDMDKKMTAVCPYCHNTVIFAEFDWVLDSIEHINDDTEICNMPVRKM